MQFATPCGATVIRDAKPRRSAKLDSDHIRALRNEEWRRAHDDGLPHPLDPSRLIKRSVAEIALIWAHEERTVRRGIQAAREILKELRRASA